MSNKTMTVKEFIRILKFYNPNLMVRFHTAHKHDLELLSDYVEDNSQYLEIDIE